MRAPVCESVRACECVCVLTRTFLRVYMKLKIIEESWICILTSLKVEAMNRT